MTTSVIETAATGRAGLWTGRVLSGLVILFLIMDATMKLLDLPQVEEATAQLGFPQSSIFTIAVLEAICIVLYLIPRTAVLGAIVLTGLLGGTVAAHIRVGDPLFSHVLFGVYIGILAWGGLWLRDPKVRELLPLRRTA